jgi:hypothetical protein
VSYRGKVKNGGNNRNASDNVEHIFGNGFEHKPPPWDADPSEGALNWALIFDKQPSSPDSLQRISVNASHVARAVPAQRTHSAAA